MLQQQQQHTNIIANRWWPLIGTLDVMRKLLLLLLLQLASCTLGTSPNLNQTDILYMHEKR